MNAKEAREINHNFTGTAPWQDGGSQYFKALGYLESHQKAQKLAKYIKESIPRGELDSERIRILKEWETES